MDSSFQEHSARQREAKGRFGVPVYYCRNVDKGKNRSRRGPRLVRSARSSRKSYALTAIDAARQQRSPVFGRLVMANELITSRLLTNPTPATPPPSAASSEPKINLPAGHAPHAAAARKPDVDWAQILTWGGLGLLGLGVLIAVPLLFKGSGGGGSNVRTMSLAPGA